MAKILVIDDDAQLLRMMSMMLERGGHSSVLVSEPQQGLKRIIEERPDLLILDVMMPSLSGHDLCEQIRANAEIPDLPILILTARSQPIDRQAALDSGANDYMSKPVMPRELMEKIDQLLVPPVSSRVGTLISLFSMRGGVGCTTIATNLAAALRRISGEEVCLIDLTPSGGQAVLHLRLTTDKSWLDLPSVTQLDWPTLKENLLLHQSGLRVLAAPRMPQLPIAPAGETTDAVLALLRQHMGFIVLDLPPLLNPSVQVALEQSDMVLHLVRPEVVSVQVALQTNAALARQDLKIKQKAYIINQIKPDAQLPADAVSRGLKGRIAFQIGYDPNQDKAVTQGIPLSLTPAQSALPIVVQRMAASLWERMQSGQPEI